jgi:hypothetical protein
MSWSYAANFEPSAHPTSREPYIGPPSFDGLPITLAGAGAACCGRAAELYSFFEFAADWACCVGSWTKPPSLTGFPEYGEAELWEDVDRATAPVGSPGGPPSLLAFCAKAGTETSAAPSASAVKLMLICLFMGFSPLKLRRVAAMGKAAARAASVELARGSLIDIEWEP